MLFWAWTVFTLYSVFAVHCGERGVICALGGHHLCIRGTSSVHCEDIMIIWGLIIIALAVFHNSNGVPLNALTTSLQFIENPSVHSWYPPHKSWCLPMYCWYSSVHWITPSAVMISPQCACTAHTLSNWQGDFDLTLKTKRLVNENHPEGAASSTGAKHLK